MPNLRKKLPSANALFVFEAAARCGNFTRAAQELYVSQPAVSRMLARMEDHLGVRLFERVRGGIELTENGRILYRKISEGFSGIEGAIREIEARATGVESVTLSVSTAFTTHWLMPRMNRLNQAFPSVDLRFQLISGRIGGPLVDVDLGMRFMTQDEIGANSVLVMPEVLLPVCNRRYHEQALLDEAGAHGDTVIVMDDGERGWHDRFSAFAEHKRRAASMLSFNDYAIVVQAALLGQGIAHAMEGNSRPPTMMTTATRRSIAPSRSTSVRCSQTAASQPCASQGDEERTIPVAIPKVNSVSPIVAAAVAMSFTVVSEGSR